jgi:glutamate/tyrosine decarboxylase-like PLP-dependent enzyme
MTARMLGAPVEPASDAERVVGTVTSGGTESIVLAMKSYRDRARSRGIRQSEIVAPVSAHVAFDKAAELLRMTIVRVPVAGDFRADVRAMKRAITRRTAVLVGSAPGYPHGVVDPISELSALALERRVGLHVDACLGGFVLPFARKLGYSVPDFDFSLSGVSSMSADTHKYGYAAKGTSVVLYRGTELRRFQYFVSTNWPGGLYFSPTLAGSRPGALVAATWAAMVRIGERGYLDATRRILDTARAIRIGIEKIPGLHVLGDPLWVIAFGSDSIDIYRVLDAMAARGWTLNGLQRPPSVHFCVTLRHTEPGIAERFVEDLRAAALEVRKTPATGSGLAPVYGLAGSFPVRGAVAELLRRFVDKLYG